MTVQIVVAARRLSTDATKERISKIKRSSTTTFKNYSPIAFVAFFQQWSLLMIMIDEELTLQVLRKSDTKLKSYTSINERSNMVVWNFSRL